jgi:hypothetical protein
MLHPDRKSKPVFIVGSPRSGTSILSWCLGQHSNILVQEESDWMGRFAEDIGVAYEIGTRRGERSQLSSIGLKRPDFFAAFGEAINALLINQRKEFENIAWARAAANPNRPQDGFALSRAESDPKSRWIDASPENSLYICALRKLFPDAVFIHLLRDVESVVRSLLNFGRTAGFNIVENQEEAYQYWLRTVRACFQAEQAYGSEIVRRVQYTTLITHPELTLRSLLQFLGEPYEPACLEPLRTRINSSNVSEDFDSCNSATNPKVVEESLSLQAELMAKPGPFESSLPIIAELERIFDERVRYTWNIHSNFRKSSERIAELERQLEELKARPSEVIQNSNPANSLMKPATPVPASLRRLLIRLRGRS